LTPLFLQRTNSSLTLKRQCKPEGLALQGIEGLALQGILMISLIFNYMSTF
jgi:hypothetical protein